MYIELTRFEINNLLEETGDDIAFIKIFFTTIQIKETLIPLSIPFEKLTSFIEKVDGDAYQYLLKIRQTIGGYGSKHSKIFETIDREGFDLKPYIQDYLQSLDESIINQHLEWCKTAIKNNASIQEKAEKIKAIITPSYIQDNKNKYLYLEALDQAIHEVNLKYFPIIYQGNEAFINNYKSLLIDASLKFYEQLDKLIQQHNEN